MDRRDYIAKFGTLLDSLPNIEIDTNKMVATWWDDDFDLCELGSEEKPYKIRLRWKVCETCDGRGTHVNPSIDAHGISSEDFDEDPDFREEYMSGMYDVPCYECSGRTTSLEISEHSDKKALDATNKYLNEIAKDRLQQEYEERYGY